MDGGAEWGRVIGFVRGVESGGGERERLLWSRIDGHQKSITDLNRIDGLLGWRVKGGGNEDAPRGGDEAGGGGGRGLLGLLTTRKTHTLIGRRGNARKTVLKSQ